ncbi:MAG TPA: hypothetical protein VFN38_12635 [Gemmatimonadaceae bacterium]|nr:hypothetical protein [Gemmatimonadaceae bacterium]
MSSSTPSTAAIARGVNFVLAREYVINTHGEAVWARALARVSPEERRVWEQPLLTVSSYDFGAFKAVTAAVAREINASGDRAVAAMYAYIAERSLNSFYKVFFRLANPSFVIGNFPKLWSRFFTAGEVQVPVAQRERAELRFTVPDIFLDWLGPACLGYSTKALELAGGHDVTVREVERRALGAGLWQVAYDVVWREG